MGADHVLTARDLIGHLALLGDVDAPVIVKRGLFGHEVTTIRAHGMLMDPDLHLGLHRPLHQLTIADLTADEPDADRGWQVRAAHLSSLLDRIGEPHGRP